VTTHAAEIERIFKSLCRRFNKANVKAERSYYFSLGESEKWTVVITKDKCTVSKGRNEESDVFFKGPPELFLDVWNGRHQLGPKDFLTGKVKSNKPLLLKDFVAAFQGSEKKGEKR
jgi:putative sterol carrier protein